MYFPVAGIEVNPLVPPLVAFVVSFFTSMGGVSGAFMLLPFQVSVLGYSAPSVSATNQLFNIVAIPGGIYRFIREQRMLWPLAWAVIIGTLPGVFIGAWVRVQWLPDPKNFKFFAGMVLLYLGYRLVLDVWKGGKGKSMAGARGKQPSVGQATFSMVKISFEFDQETYSVSTFQIYLLCFIVGIIGGIYGIGGGSIIAPFMVAIFGLPVYTVAGAALMGTFATSIAGVAFYSFLARFYPGISVAPDIGLGILFGVGGLAGIYLGARCQKYFSPRVIKAVLCFCVLFVAGKYILGFFV
ncbi:MAG: sulfite exporter TauE/SafE family protein [Desulfatibacillum sp.]|nr:sulfite exporter TauE/SafE family protein [Desulfatibacillum sp.]